jgi:hypothetical protein
MTPVPGAVVSETGPATDTADGPRRDRSPVVGRALVGLIRAYQLVRTGRSTGCRFIPSCSEYAVEAVETHGALRGAALTARRLSRCTPWGGHGVDPVPDRRTPCTHP